MLEIKYKATAELIPYVNNSRTYSERRVQQVAASIKEFGFTNPILIDEAGGIIAGHGRLMAAQLLNLDEVPTIRLEGLTEAQRKAYVIADNKLAFLLMYQPKSAISYELWRSEYMDDLREVMK